MKRKMKLPDWVVVTSFSFLSSSSVLPSLSTSRFFSSSVVFTFALKLVDLLYQLDIFIRKSLVTDISFCINKNLIYFLASFPFLRWVTLALVFREVLVFDFWSFLFISLLYIKIWCVGKFLASIFGCISKIWNFLWGRTIDMYEWTHDIHLSLIWKKKISYFIWKYFIF